MIAYTIETALQCKALDRLLVSTDDAEIREVALAYGAEAPFLRPAELATDDATTLSVLQHVVTQLPAEVVVFLQPSCPIRDEGLVDRCVQRFLEREVDSLATGFMCKDTEYGKDPEDVRRQDIEGFFCDDGNVYVIKADLLRRGDRYGTRHEHILLNREQNIDIDDEIDMWLAEQVLSRRLQAVR